MVFDFLEPKATKIPLWRGSKSTKKSLRKKKRVTETPKTTENDGVLITLVRTRKGFDVKFLADTFGMNSSQVLRIYNTRITLLSQKLSFLVPWPSRSELQIKMSSKKIKKI